MHLLLIHQNFPGQFRELAPAWMARGHRVTAIGAAERPPDGPGWEPLHYLRYSFEDEAHPSAEQRGHAVAQVCRWLEANAMGPDVVLAHSGWGETLELRTVWPDLPLVVFPELWGNPRALGFGFDAALEGQSIDPDLFEAANHCAAHAIQSSNLALVASEAQRDSFPEPLRETIQVLAEGVNLQRIPDALPPLPAGCGLPNEDTAALVTVVSRTLEPLRGLGQVLRSWPIVSAAQPQARLLLIGGDGEGYGLSPPHGPSHLSDALDALPAEVDRTRIHRLTWLDHDDLLAVLQHSQCHLALSYPYTLSWSVLEALACGVPLVSNHGSPIAADLTHRMNGLLVPFNATAELAQAVLALLEQPALRNQLGAAAKATVADRFSLERSLERFEQLFAQLTTNGPSGCC